MAFCRQQAAPPVHALPVAVSSRASWMAGLAAATLLVALPLLAPFANTLAVMDSFYRAGALVFGGGHVVLPLLEAEVVQSGWVSASQFLSGYGAAQALPGPLFSFAAYLGTIMTPGGGLLRAAMALGMIFLPGMLLLLAVLPHWNRFRHQTRTQALMRGANAAVVGILAAAFCHPVWSSTITGPLPLVLALLGFGLLTRLPPWAVVVLLAGAGAVTRLVTLF